MIKPKQHNNFYVITGGPGVGKTTLLKELQRRNYNVIPEIARELIKEQQKRMVEPYLGKIRIYIKI